jgi:CRP-like cAMP-binding protein
MNQFTRMSFLGEQYSRVAAASTESLADWLQAIPIFEEIERKHLEAVAAMARTRIYARGETVVREGDAGDSVFAIRRGSLKVSIAETGGRVTTLGIMGPGEIFGELSLLDGRPRSATVTALTRARLVVIERDAFWKLLQSTPRAGISILGVLAKRLRRLSQRSESISGLRVRRRLARQLVLLTESHGQRMGPNRMRIGVKLTQQELGELVGATRESVNKHLSELKDEKILIREGGYLIVVDLGRLRGIAYSDFD